ncbi:MAG: HWE histidine kinase domain-containing protein, partial [Pseudolabrys sp.]
HFDSPHRPTEQELRQLDLVSWQAANYLERKQAEQNEKLLVDELQHRTNNLLTIIQSIAQRSFSGSYPLAQAKEIFDARLQALARTHHKLTKSNVSWLSLEEIVKPNWILFLIERKLRAPVFCLITNRRRDFHSPSTSLPLMR